MQRAVRSCIMRGGTSKGIFLLAADLPPPGPQRDAVILRIFGSPDPRQIDGLGGADTLTSKLAIIAPPTIPSADVDYTFGQVSFVDAKVDYGGNCGNISSAVGPFAVDKGLIQIPHDEKSHVVKIHNTNTGALLKSTVHLSDRKTALVEGEVEIAGVPGSGAPVDLDFSATQGSVTGRLLPSGQLLDQLSIPGSSGELIEATLLDAGQPMVFLRAADLFKDRLEVAAATPQAQAEVLKTDTQLLRRVECIRGVAAVKMGIVQSWEEAEKVSPYTPFVAAISAAPSKDADFTSVCVFMQKVHQAYPVTGSVATAAAALLEGSIVQAASQQHGASESGEDEKHALVRIAHPSGVMDVHAAVRTGTEPSLLKAALRRTARCLMDGQAYVPWSVWPAD